MFLLLQNLSKRFFGFMLDKLMTFYNYWTFKRKASLKKLYLKLVYFVLCNHIKFDLLFKGDMTPSLEALDKDRRYRFTRENKMLQELLKNAS